MKVDIDWNARGKIFNSLNKFLHDTLLRHPNMALIAFFFEEEEKWYDYEMKLPRI
jgi:hypothetical protein